LNREDPMANFVLALTYERLGAQEDAVRQWHRYLSIRDTPVEDRAFATERVTRLQPVGSFSRTP
jgi:hypothetical protein